MPGNGRLATRFQRHLRRGIRFDFSFIAPDHGGIVSVACVSVASIAFLAALAGCGNSYRATVGTGNPVPISTQPSYLPVVTSFSGVVQNGAVSLDTGQGTATILDLAGDSVQDIVNVGIAPTALTLGSGGGIAYVVNLGSQDATGNYVGSVSSFNVTTTVLNAGVSTTTLDGSTAEVFAPPAAAPTTPCDVVAPQPAISTNSSLIYVAQTTTTAGSTAGTLLPLSRNISGTGVPAVLTPLSTTGVITRFTGLTAGARTYAIERDANEVDSIDLTSATPTQPYISQQFTGFTTPVFGVTSFDGYRTFILNCNGTVTVIDSQANAILQSKPSIPILGSGSVPAGNPIWGDYWNAGSLLVTANTNGPGIPGTVSVINAAESASSFGTVLGTAVVGYNPSGITVLQNGQSSGSTAYVANEGDADTTPIPVNGQTVSCDCKTVSVVSLTSNSTINTLPLYYEGSQSTATCPAGAPLAGYPSRPTQLLASPDTVDQKVYVLCDRPSANGVFYVFVIRTYATSGIVGGSSNANVVIGAIPIGGIPTQLKMTPAR